MNGSLQFLYTYKIQDQLLRSCKILSHNLLHDMPQMLTFCLVFIHSHKRFDCGFEYYNLIFVNITGWFSKGTR